MQIKHKHNLSKGEAYQKIDTFLDGLQEEYSSEISNPNKSWNSDYDRMDFSFKARGFKLNGVVCLVDGMVILEGKLPWLARAYSSKIEEVIIGQLDDLLSKSCNI